MPKSRTQKRAAKRERKRTLMKQEMSLSEVEALLKLRNIQQINFNPDTKPDIVTIWYKE